MSDANCGVGKLREDHRLPPPTARGLPQESDFTGLAPSTGFETRAAQP